ncbi:MAG TPA: peptidase M20 [Bacteroidales bacterium]|nr:peptidase M20 [Bacteroidales bacterium]
MDVISLTRKLLSFNTINPPGNEEGIARYTGAILEENGFYVNYYPYGENRLQLVAEKGITPGNPPVVFSGHFDTVPPGNNPWSTDPFGGEVFDGKIWGRGSADMKGALAAMMIAAIEASDENPGGRGIRLIFTADEEPGCRGVMELIKSFTDRHNASAVIVGEPTENLPATGHKGAIYLLGKCMGKTAHSSMPEKGINAIYKAARSIIRLSEVRFDAEIDPLLGYPTINIGKINGGMNINSVPDNAEFTIDIRTTSGTDHEAIIRKIEEEIGGETVLETLVNINPVYTSSDNPFVRLVYDICGIREQSPGFPLALPYLTDGAVLQRFYSGAPTVILGPGQPEMAHQTNEYCYIEKLESCVKIYKKIISNMKL